MALTTVKGAVLNRGVNVKDYGAKGDGVTDDTAAFQAADALGILVYVPAPSVKYTFASPFTMSSPLEVDPSITWANLTDSGKLSFIGGRTSATGAIERVTDRIFIGEAASRMAGDSLSTDGGNTWFDNTNYPGYLAINGAVVNTNEAGATSPNYSFVSGLRSSNTTGSIIGLGSAIIVDDTNARGWGAIMEMQREDDTSKCNAIEIASKNKGNNTTCTPVTLASGGPVGDYGLWFAAGGDPVFGGSSVNPSTCAMAVLSNDNTWNTGIAFAQDGLTSGEAISLSSQGTGGAHRLQWYNSSGNSVFSVTSSASDTDNWTLNRNNTGISMQKGGTEILRVAGPASNVNGVNIYGGATGVPPQVASIGSDTNVDLRLVPKGTGVLRFGTHSAIGAETVTGYITIKDNSGTSRKIAVVS